VGLVRAMRRWLPCGQSRCFGRRMCHLRRAGDEGLLDYAPAEAERISVRKRTGQRPWTQAQIDELLLDRPDRQDSRTAQAAIPGCLAGRRRRRRCA